MKVVALVSGGKDSCYAMMKCLQYGHQIVALANLMPADDSVDELDSYMYQTTSSLTTLSVHAIRDIQEVVKEIRDGFETTFSFENEAAVLLEVASCISA
ncbi:hypothetical protein TorRG33x02_302260 [Trema orientale]|uniref:Diphthine--ammonia ligase n=1 Tax=Trema orientale TaxID=63057 RepID=A0A2P5C0G9_TREOI|nr:hypothetical protein TorRG33x02_302260 [Trema orientale]